MADSDGGSVAGRPGNGIGTVIGTVTVRDVVGIRSSSTEASTREGSEDGGAPTLGGPT